LDVLKRNEIFVGLMKTLVISMLFVIKRINQAKEGTLTELKRDNTPQHYITRHKP
jgi:hypothetical protein